MENLLFRIENQMQTGTNYWNLIRSNKQVSKREIESCACRCNKAWGPKFKSGVELISYRESGLEEERFI